LSKSILEKSSRKSNIFSFIYFSPWSRRASNIFFFSGLMD
jgi:hypothetical protein